MANDQVLTTAIGGVLGLVGTIAAGWFALRQLRIKSDISKNQVKIETVKETATAEAKRLDQIWGQQQKIIDTLQEENAVQAKKMVQMDKVIDNIRNRMESCFEERLDLKLEVQGMKAQLSSVKNYQDAMNKAVSEIDPQVLKKIREKTIKEDLDATKKKNKKVV